MWSKKPTPVAIVAAARPVEGEREGDVGLGRSGGSTAPRRALAVRVSRVMVGRAF